MGVTGKAVEVKKPGHLSSYTPVLPNSPLWGGPGLCLLQDYLKAKELKMVKQIFHDVGVEFDTDDIVGNMSWDQFISYCKEDGIDAHVVRLRFIGDYVERDHLILDFSYAYVSVDGDIYNVTFFPIDNWHGINRGAFRKELYKMAKKTEAFIPNMFSALSLHI